jgi:hypothetical protein
MESTLQQPRNMRGFGYFLLLCFLGAVLFSVAVSFHAVEKHGENIVTQVANCNNFNQATLNPNTNRIACVFNLDEKKFGIRILMKDGEGNFHEITSFIKDKMTKETQVMKYLKNVGYTLPADAALVEEILNVLMK